jgi:Ulp1 family protease
MVINLDVHTQGGSHWVALYTDLEKGQIYYFDSFAKKPSKRTKKFINKILKYLYKKKYNKDININSLIKKIKNGEKTKYLDNLKEFDIRYNNIQHQFNNSECGVYSINFIVRLVGDENFDEITKNIKKDNEMNKCRTKYFRNVNIK